MRARPRRARAHEFDLDAPEPEDDDIDPAEARASRSRLVQKRVAKAQRLNAAVRPCLTTVAQLCQLKREQKPPPEIVQRHMRSLLNDSMSRLEALSLPHEELQDLRYGLVAFIDEFMQLESGRLRDFWQANLLQLEFFGETRAGEGFFERLERAKTEGRQHVLQVYYLCLLSGFHGVYGRHGELERENLIEGLKSLLGQGRKNTPALSPHGARPLEAGVDRTRNRLLQWFAVAAAAMAVIWYFGLVFTLDAQEQVLTDALREAYEDVTAGFAGPRE